MIPVKNTNNSSSSLVGGAGGKSTNGSNGLFYNGIHTIKLKTRLALDQKLGGVMVWEVRYDTIDEPL